MEIIEKSKEFTTKEMYNLTASNTAISVKDVEDNGEITVSGYIFYRKEDANDPTKSVELLSILGTDGVVWCTQSETFKKEFRNILSLIAENGGTLEGEGVTLRKLSGTTKAGRPYVTCVWA